MAISTAAIERVAASTAASPHSGGVGPALVSIAEARGAGCFARAHRGTSAPSSAHARHSACERSGGILASERGSGAVLIVAVLAAVMLLAATLIPLGGAFTASQHAANAADAAALAAADVATGRMPGVSCSSAAQAAALNGATLDSCEVHGAVARVSVTVSWSALGQQLHARARARAGPPGTP